MTEASEFDIVPLQTGAPETLAALHRRVMGEPDGWSDSGLRRLLTANAARGLQAELGGELAGYVLAFVAADEAEILALCVAPEHRRQGIARALLRQLAKLLATGGTNHLHLEVRASNLAARELYARSGFVETGRRKGYYHGADGALAEDAVTMTLRLSAPPGARERMF